MSESDDHIYDYPEHVKERFLTNRAYDVLKYIAQIGLPALGTLYFALAGLWGFPNGEQVVGTIAAVNVFLGVILGYSNKTYYGSENNFDGSIDVEDQGDGKKLFSLNLNGDPNELDSKREVTFKINSL